MYPQYHTPNIQQYKNFCCDHYHNKKIVVKWLLFCLSKIQGQNYKINEIGDLWFYLRVLKKEAGYESEEDE
jgi:hypothetical protein